MNILPHEMISEIFSYLLPGKLFDLCIFNKNFVRYIKRGKVKVIGEMIFQEDVYGALKTIRNIIISIKTDLVFTCRKAYKLYRPEYFTEINEADDIPVGEAYLFESYITLHDRGTGWVSYSVENKEYYIICDGVVYVMSKDVFNVHRNALMKRCIIIYTAPKEMSNTCILSRNGEFIWINLNT